MKTNKILLEGITVGILYYVFRKYDKRLFQSVIENMTKPYLKEEMVEMICPKCSKKLYTNIHEIKCEIPGCEYYNNLILECLNEDCLFTLCKGAI